jgi:transposase
MVLSVEERTFLVEHVCQCVGEYTQDVQQRFQAQFPETKVPHHNTMQQVIQKFKETGCMCDATRSGRPSILTEKKVLDISDCMFQSPKKSIRKLSQQVGVSYDTAHTALKKHLCLHPYKITAMHELKSDDSAKRVVYCEWFLDFLDHEGEDTFDVTFFTDEAYFHLLGYINSQNSHVWCAYNPHAFHKSLLHDEKIGDVWVGMSRRRIVGPIFFSETLNSQQYCDNILTLHCTIERG